MKLYRVNYSFGLTISADTEDEADIKGIQALKELAKEEGFETYIEDFNIEEL